MFLVVCADERKLPPQGTERSVANWLFCEAISVKKNIENK